MPVYRFGDIRTRRGSVTVDIPALHVNMPSRAEIEAEAIVDQDRFVHDRLLGLAMGFGRFRGLADRARNDHAITPEPASVLREAYADKYKDGGGYSRMSNWLRLMVLSKRVLQHTLDKIMARAFGTTASAIKIERVKRTIKGTAKATAEQRQKRHIRRIIKKFGPA